MARKKEEFVNRGPSREEGIELAAKVFGLQQKLGISNEQMAEEAGFSKGTISSLKHVWFSGKSKKQPARMKPSMANGLKQFYNAHLTNGPANPDVASTPQLTKNRKGKHPEQQTVISPVAVLVQKVGLAKAEKMLTERGKQDQFKDFLQTLSPEALADLV